MNLAIGFGRLVAALIATLPCAVGAPRAEDLAQAVMLVATTELDDTDFQRTVLVAAPLAQGGYIGFIINRPTTLKLENLLPDKASSGRVVDPVYFGGPMLPRVVFALARRAPNSHAGVIPLIPNLFAVLDSDDVDQVVKTTPNEARYFLGLIIWDSDQLQQEVRAGLWEVRPVDETAVFRGGPTGLWREFQGKGLKWKSQYVDLSSGCNDLC
jgi:putative transcriptional regulator